VDVQWVAPAPFIFIESLFEHKVFWSVYVCLHIYYSQFHPCCCKQQDFFYHDKYYSILVMLSVFLFICYLLSCFLLKILSSIAHFVIGVYILSSRFAWFTYIVWVLTFIRCMTLNFFSGSIDCLSLYFISSRSLIFIYYHLFTFTMLPSLIESIYPQFPNAV
jgi:hypothetical protein